MYILGAILYSESVHDEHIGNGVVIGETETKKYCGFDYSWADYESC